MILMVNIDCVCWFNSVSKLSIVDQNIRMTITMPFDWRISWTRELNTTVRDGYKWSQSFFVLTWVAMMEWLDPAHGLVMLWKQLTAIVKRTYTVTQRVVLSRAWMKVLAHMMCMASRIWYAGYILYYSAYMICMSTFWLDLKLSGRLKEIQLSINGKRVRTRTHERTRSRRRMKAQ